MGIGSRILLRMFGRPRGLLGRVSGIIMARTNRRHAVWATGLLDVGPQDRVLEVGCGAGVAIELLARQARAVTGIDPSREMLRQAGIRNALAISDSLVALHQASAERLPLPELVAAAGFRDCRVVTADQVFCMLAVNA